MALMPVAPVFAAAGAGAGAAGGGGALAYGLQLAAAAATGGTAVYCCKRRRTDRHPGLPAQRLASAEERLARCEERMGRLEASKEEEAAKGRALARENQRLADLLGGKADAASVDGRLEEVQDLKEVFHEWSSRTGLLEQQVGSVYEALARRPTMNDVEERLLAASAGQMEHLAAATVQAQERSAAVALELERKADGAKVQQEMQALAKSFREKADKYLADVNKSLAEKADAAHVNQGFQEMQVQQQRAIAEVNHKVTSLAQKMDVLSDGLSAGLAYATSELEAVKVPERLALTTRPAAVQHYPMLV